MAYGDIGGGETGGKGRRDYSETEGVENGGVYVPWLLDAIRPQKSEGTFKKKRSPERSFPTDRRIHFLPNFDC